MRASPSSRVLAAWDGVVGGLLRHRADTAERLAAVLQLDPDFVPALCLRGFALLFQGRAALRVEAVGWADRARAALSDGGEPGDRELVQALTAWAGDDPWAAEAALQERLRRRPHDPFAVKLQHGLLFLMGQSRTMRERVEAHAAGWPGDDPARGFVLGATIFARVECGDLEAATEMQQRWAERPADDAWGLHAVAHLLHERGEHAAALDWLDARRTRWAACDRFGNHLDWHRALLHLRLGCPATALALYDEHLRGVFDGNYRDMSNAVSILWRLEARGVDVGSRWRELAEASASLIGDHGSAFADAHYVLAQLHGGSPGAAERLVATMARRDEGYQADVVWRVGRPLCAALMAWQRDPTACRDGLRALQPVLGLIGGSNAQRSLFGDVLAHVER